MQKIIENTIFGVAILAIIITLPISLPCYLIGLITTKIIDFLERKYVDKNQNVR